MSIHRIAPARIAAAVLLAALALAAGDALAQIPVFPTVPVQPEYAPDPTANWFIPFVEYQYTYDDNLFRLPTARDYPNVGQLIPPGASKQDSINTGSAGFDGHWVASRQSVDYDVEIDENRFVRNTNLDNPSGAARAVWNWAVADDFSGQLGGNYGRSLAGFTDSFFFSRDIIDRQEYFANGRYQIGPRWAVYGSLDDAYTKNEALPEQFNDLDLKTGKVGVELATSQQNTVGAEYRFTHGHYPHQTSFLDNELTDPDYNENSGVFLFKYAVTDKTVLNADAGYLRRNYPSNPGVGAFSGDIWHVKFQWQATDKTSLSVTGSRDLQAYLYAQSDYFVQNGVAISPVWVQSDKLTWVLVASWYKQDYINASFSDIILGAARHDTISAQQVGLQYTPIRPLAFTFTYRHELRNSSQAQFGYGDDIANVGVKFKF